MLGNDIIDLAKVTLKNARKDRFIEKIFTKEEQSFLEKEPFLNQQIWVLWSMKESAYKLSVQRGRLKKFNPLEFTCEFSDQYKARVWVDDSFSHCQVELGTSYIHCQAWITEGCRSKHIIKSTTQKNMQTEELYDHAITAIAKSFKYNKAQISIKKNESQVPIVYVDQVKQAIALSLSHHGRYGAYLFSSSS